MSAIGVECIRERSTGQQPPHQRLHVSLWWARRPLTVSRAAVAFGAPEVIAEKIEQYIAGGGGVRHPA